MLNAQNKQIEHTYSGASNHQIGFNHVTNNPPYTSSFLLHTPREALLSTISRSSRHLHRYTQTPASIITKMRLNKYRTTTPMTTTPLRGDQQPPTDEDSLDDIDEFIPLGVKNQPVSVLPIYFTNERDNTQRRIN